MSGGKGTVLTAQVRRALPTSGCMSMGMIWLSVEHYIFI